MNVGDDLYLGTFLPAGLSLAATQSGAPQLEQGVGPMGRVSFLNIVPLTKGNTNVAASQHMTTAVGLTLAAGTGTTAVTLPNGQAAIQFDVPRAVSITSASDLSAISFTISGIDLYNQPMTQTRLGPNATTVNTLKAFKAITSVVPDTTDGTHNVSIGSADIFGLSFACVDAGYIIAKWAETLALDAGTFVAAVITDPNTAAIGDVRGTYAPSSVSNGTKRLVIWQHLTATQCGSSATQAAAIGVTPV